MRTLSKKAGLSEGYISGIIKTGRTPSVDNLISIAHAAKVEPGWLLMGDETFRIKIPIVGTASAGEEWSLSTATKPNTLEFDLGSGYDVIGIEVRGDAMAPVYRDQDFVVCQRRMGSYADNLIGTDCAVRTLAGKNYLKILKKGTRPNHFTLRSYNSAVDDVENVQLEWVAPVVWIKRGGR
jgi:transcriptional regulator with XRE-family HTH domain